MLQRIAEIYQSYGFEALESSAVETVEALGKFLPDVDQPNEGVFAWQEDNQDWLALRYDLTAPLARVYAQYRNELPTHTDGIQWGQYGEMRNPVQAVLDSSINVMPTR